MTWDLAVGEQQHPERWRGVGQTDATTKYLPQKTTLNRTLHYRAPACGDPQHCPLLPLLVAGVIALPSPNCPTSTHGSGTLSCTTPCRTDHPRTHRQHTVPHKAPSGPGRHTAAHRALGPVAPPGAANAHVRPIRPWPVPRIQKLRMSMSRAADGVALRRDGPRVPARAAQAAPR